MEHTIEPLTGLRLELTTTVPVPPPTLWAMVVDVPRIGAWSPECIGASWLDGATAAVPGARFAAENRFGPADDPVVRPVEGVVTEVEAEHVFAWAMLDEAGEVASRWRYDLSPVDGGTRVRHTWEHGPGLTGMRTDAHADRTSVGRRLGVLACHMHATLSAMEQQVLEEVA